MDSEPKAATKIPPPDAGGGGDETPRRQGRPKGSKNRRPKLEEELTQFFTEAGAVLMFRDPFDGMVVIENAETNAKELMKLARKSPRVKTALEALVQVSALGAAITALGATIVPILMHHGVVPPHIPIEKMEWMVPPERALFLQQQAEKAKGNGNGG